MGLLRRHNDPKSYGFLFPHTTTIGFYILKWQNYPCHKNTIF